jgi:hypothetical protein
MGGRATGEKKAMTHNPDAGVARQAAKLTLGIWAFTFLLFLMPQLVATGRMPVFIFGAVAISILVGIAFSAALY